MNFDAEWTLFLCSEKFNKCLEDCASETFILLEKLHVAIHEKWIKEEDEVRRKLYLPSLYF